MCQKTDQVHIEDHFYSSLKLQGHLQTAGAEQYTPQIWAIGGTVFIYLVHVYNEQEKRKSTALS